jgi:phosphatidylinositol-3-phosphatase
MQRKYGRSLGVSAVLATGVAAVAIASSASASTDTSAAAGHRAAPIVVAANAPAKKATKKTTVVRAALPAGAIKHIFVIELENSSENVTFGTEDKSSYIENTLEKQGVFIPKFYGSGHASLDNYLSSVSGQAPAPADASDCSAEPGVKGSDVHFNNVKPGTWANQKKFPGQVNATSGCVYPSDVKTIANQLDSKYGVNKSSGLAPWRDYEQDMGLDPKRDGGVADSMGGTDCAHPAIGANNDTNSAESAADSSTGVADQFAVRHDPFQWFHSIINDKALCDHNVVPLGTVEPGTASTFNGTHLANTFTGRLISNLKSTATTPKFGWITPNLCNDGHDGGSAACTGPNANGSVQNPAGGNQLKNINLFLQQWVPLLEASPAYKQGHMLIVITTDEAEVPAGGTEQDASQLRGVPGGPSLAEPGRGDALLYKQLGYGTLTTDPADGPGGGKVGALILGSSKYIKHGSVDTKVGYDQYSALRSYEDLLGITTGGSDKHGHLGYAGLKVIKPFGSDVFNAYKAPKKKSKKK